MSGIVGGGFALFMLASCVAIVSNGASDDGSATADSSSISEPVVEQPVEAPPVEAAPVEPPIVEAPPAPVVEPPAAVQPTKTFYQNCTDLKSKRSYPIYDTDIDWDEKFDGKDKDGIGCES